MLVLRGVEYFSWDGAIFLIAHGQGFRYRVTTYNSFCQKRLGGPNHNPWFVQLKLKKKKTEITWGLQYMSNKFPKLLSKKHPPPTPATPPRNHGHPRNHGNPRLLQLRTEGDGAAAVVHRTTVTDLLPGHWRVLLGGDAAADGNASFFGGIPDTRGAQTYVIGAPFTNLGPFIGAQKRMILLF